MRSQTEAGKETQRACRGRDRKSRSCCCDRRAASLRVLEARTGSHSPFRGTQSAHSRALRSERESAKIVATRLEASHRLSVTSAVTETHCPRRNRPISAKRRHASPLDLVGLLRSIPILPVCPYRAFGVMTSSADAVGRLRSPQAPEAWLCQRLAWASTAAISLRYAHDGAHDRKDASLVRPPALRGCHLHARPNGRGAHRAAQSAAVELAVAHGDAARLLARAHHRQGPWI